MVLHCKKDVRIQKKEECQELPFLQHIHIHEMGASQLKHMHRMHSSLKEDESITVEMSAGLSSTFELVHVNCVSYTQIPL